MDRTGSASSGALDAAFFLALVATSVAMAGALAHLLELANKIGMNRDDYFTLQQAYRGWNMLAFLLLIEAGSMVTVIVLASDVRPIWLPTLGALACLIAAQVVFWLYTQPANAATRNWTMKPDNWAALRTQWEYSHAAGALLQLLAMALMIVAVLRRDRL